MEENSTGIWISSPGVAVGSASPSQLVMNTSDPFFKLDTQNPAGFNTFEILINTDPPEPPGGGGDTYTIIHSYPHNYNYIPTVEMLTTVTSPPPGSTGNQTQLYFQDAGILLRTSQDSSADFYIVVDATNIYLVVHKSNDGYGPANLLTGTNLLVSVHVFVEDLLTNE